MEWIESIQDGFRYDRWANDRWLEFLPALAEVPDCADVFQHMLTAQRVWLARCLSEEEVPALSGDLSKDIGSLSDGWMELLRTCDPGAYVSYTNTRGESYFNTVEQIARHVLMHGMYHRGHLRGLAGANGREFPETDYIVYVRSLGD